MRDRFASGLLVSGYYTYVYNRMLQHIYVLTSIDMNVGIIVIIININIAENNKETK